MKHILLSIGLRIPAIHGAKTTKIRPPLICFAWLFYQTSYAQNFEIRSGCKIIKQNKPGGSVFSVLAILAIAIWPARL